MAVATASKPARLQEIYTKEFKPALQKELGLSSIMDVPKIEKIVINAGVGAAVGNPKDVDAVLTEIAAITGQQPVKTRARKSIAAFKLREGMVIGAMVTLRGKIMYEFLDRLINIALPRVRDFNGVSPKSFDHAGNYSLGIKEQIIFPEIHFDKIEKIHGFDITIVMRSKSREHSKQLLEKFNFPFRKR